MGDEKVPYRVRMKAPDSDHVRLVYVLAKSPAEAKRIAERQAQDIVEQEARSAYEAAYANDDSVTPDDIDTPEPYEVVKAERD